MRYTISVKLAPGIENLSSIPLQLADPGAKNTRFLFYGGLFSFQVQVLNSNDELVQTIDYANNAQMLCNNILLTKPTKRISDTCPRVVMTAHHGQITQMSITPYLEENEQLVLAYRLHANHIIPAYEYLDSGKGTNIPMYEQLYVNDAPYTDPDTKKQIPAGPMLDHMGVPYKAGNFVMVINPMVGYDGKSFHELQKNGRAIHQLLGARFRNFLCMIYRYRTCPKEIFAAAVEELGVPERKNLYLFLKSRPDLVQLYQPESSILKSIPHPQALMRAPMPALTLPPCNPAPFVKRPPILLKLQSEELVQTEEESDPEINVVDDEPAPAKRKEKLPSKQVRFSPY